MICYPDITAPEYHARPELAFSQLEDFAVSPTLYHGRHVAKTLLPRPESAAMRLGTACHAIVLEPDRFNEIVEVGGESDRTVAFKQQAEKIKPKTLITSGQYEICQRARDIVMRSTVVPMLAAG